MAAAAALLARHPRRGALAALLAAALACPALVLAAGDEPKVAPRAADQRAATEALLQRAQLSSDWTLVRVATPYSIKIPVCQQHQPDYGGLTLTGHAEESYDLKSDGVLVDVDVEVYASTSEVERLFHLMVTSKLPGCVRYDLATSLGTKARVASVSPLHLPAVGSARVAYRAVLDYRASGKEVPVANDVLMLAQHRTVFFVSIVGPSALESDLASFEQSLAHTLVANARV